MGVGARIVLRRHAMPKIVVEIVTMQRRHDRSIDATYVETLRKVGSGLLPGVPASAKMVTRLIDPAATAIGACRRPRAQPMSGTPNIACADSAVSMPSAIPRWPSSPMRTSRTDPPATVTEHLLAGRRLRRSIIQQVGAMNSASRLAGAIADDARPCRTIRAWCRNRSRSSLNSRSGQPGSSNPAFTEITLSYGPADRPQPARMRAISWLWSRGGCRLASGRWAIQPGLLCRLLEQRGARHAGGVMDQIDGARRLRRWRDRKPQPARGPCRWMTHEPSSRGARPESRHIAVSFGPPTCAHAERTAAANRLPSHRDDSRIASRS